MKEAKFINAWTKDLGDYHSNVANDVEFENFGTEEEEFKLKRGWVQMTEDTTHGFVIHLGMQALTAEGGNVDCPLQRSIINGARRGQNN